MYSLMSKKYLMNSFVKILSINNSYLKCNYVHLVAYDYHAYVDGGYRLQQGSCLNWYINGVIIFRLSWSPDSTEPYYPLKGGVS